MSGDSAWVGQEEIAMAKIPLTRFNLMPEMEETNVSLVVRV